MISSAVGASRRLSFGGAETRVPTATFIAPWSSKTTVLSSRSAPHRDRLRGAPRSQASCPGRGRYGRAMRPPGKRGAPKGTAAVDRADLRRRAGRRRGGALHRPEQVADAADDLERAPGQVARHRAPAHLHDPSLAPVGGRAATSAPVSPGSPGIGLISRFWWANAMTSLPGHRRQRAAGHVGRSRCSRRCRTIRRRRSCR